MEKYVNFNYITSVLSSSERRCFFLRSQGFERAEIARAMNVEVTTVDSYYSRIKEKIPMSDKDIKVLEGICIDLINSDYIE